jgi:GTP-binding protein
MYGNSFDYYRNADTVEGGQPTEEPADDDTDMEEDDEFNE